MANTNVENMIKIADAIKEDGFNCYFDDTRNAIVFVKENHIKVKNYLNQKYGEKSMIANIEPNGKDKMVITIPFSYIMIGGAA